LRKPGETGYKIPTGGLFDYITGANFFGEIVEWTGFAIASCSFLCSLSRHESMASSKLLPI
jgi:3-oxo-5-alpha-steroid 4-dehydrogenase 1